MKENMLASLGKGDSQAEAAEKQEARSHANRLGNAVPQRERPHEIFNQKS